MRMVVVGLVKATQPVLGFRVWLLRRRVGGQAAAASNVLSDGERRASRAFNLGAREGLTVTRRSIGC